MSNTEESGVLDDILGSSNDSTNESGAGEEGSENSGSQGIDPKAFNDLVSSVSGLQNQLGRWGNEMGEMRNQMTQFNQGGNQGAEDVNASPQANDTWNKLMDDPDAYMEQKIQNFQQKQYDQNQKQVNETRAALVNQAPDYLEKEEAILDMIAKKNNVDRKVVQDNYATIGTPALFNAYKRHVAQKENAEMKKLIDVMKSTGGNLEDAKRALARPTGSGDSFDPPSRADIPTTKPRDMSSEQRRTLLKKMGINKI